MICPVDSLPVMALCGTRRFPLGSLMTYIADHLYPIATVEVEHHVQCRTSVSTEHVDEGGALPGRDRRECVREELFAPEIVGLPVKVARQVRQALPVKGTKFRAVRLPLPGP